MLRCRPDVRDLPPLSSRATVLSCRSSFTSFELRECRYWDVDERWRSNVHILTSFSPFSFLFFSFLFWFYSSRSMSVAWWYMVLSAFKQGNISITSRLLDYIWDFCITSRSLVIFGDMLDITVFLSLHTVQSGPRRRWLLLWISEKFYRPFS